MMCSREPGGVAGALGTAEALSIEDFVTVAGAVAERAVFSLPSFLEPACLGSVALTVPTVPEVPADS